jgi:hypothetical protein
MGIFYVGWALATLGYLAVRALRGHSAISQYQVFMAGLVLFQMNSAASAFLFGRFGEVPVSSPVSSGVLYTGVLILFLIIFEVAYRQRWLTFGLQNKIGTPLSAPGDTTMVALAFGFLFAAALMRFVFIYVPLFFPVALISTGSLSAAAAATICWVWAKNIKNPTYTFAAIAVLLVAVGLTTFQNFGRRDLTSVAIASAWGAYHGHFKHISWKRAVLPLTGVAVAGVIAIAAFTSARTVRITEMGFGELVQRMVSADVGKSIAESMSGQDAASYSMWLIESRPEGIPYDPLHSLRNFAFTIIPRTVYPTWLLGEKPVALGMALVPQAGITGKDYATYSVGPGLVGHIVNDNPFIALPIYALLIAAWIRLMDDLTLRFPNNPFVVIPVGVAFGDILALSRGELGLFMFRAVFMTVVAYSLMWVVARVLILLGLKYTTATEDSGEDEEGAGQHDDLVDLEVQREYEQQS